MSKEPAKDLVLLDVDARGVATATLNRPEMGNAYNEDLLARADRRLAVAGTRSGGALPGAARRGAAFPGGRRHPLAGPRRKLWTGAELRRVDGDDARDAVAERVPQAHHRLVHGACFGGGAGMVCCVDVALATPDALFGLTEVRVGVAPTPISTHMVHAMGLRHTRRYALTGERFDAQEALRIGLVHEVVPADAMEAKLAEVLDAVFLGGAGCDRDDEAVISWSEWTAAGRAADGDAGA